MQWAQYRRKWGPLNAMVRAERGFALVASSVGGGKMKEMMPWPIEEEIPYEEQDAATPDQIIAGLGAVMINTSAKRS